MHLKLVHLDWGLIQEAQLGYLQLFVERMDLSQLDQNDFLQKEESVQAEYK